MNNIGLIFMTVLNETTFRTNKRKHILTEAEYFSNTTDLLLSLRCPNCSDTGGLFIGLCYVCCSNCMNYFENGSEVDYAKI